MRKGSQCLTFRRIDPITREKFYEKKKKYLRPEEAIKAANRLNSLPNRIHVVAPYKCTTCHFFHVGKLDQLIKNTL